MTARWAPVGSGFHGLGFCVKLGWWFFLFVVYWCGIALFCGFLCVCLFVCLLFWCGFIAVLQDVTLLHGVIRGFANFKMASARWQQKTVK